MSDNPKGRGVVDSIRALRERRFNEYGPGSKRAPAKPSVDQLRDHVAKIPAKSPEKKKAKKTKRGKRK